MVSRSYDVESQEQWIMDLCVHDCRDSLHCIVALVGAVSVCVPEYGPVD